jgi:hypothetical protein
MSSPIFFRWVFGAFAIVASIGTTTEGSANPPESITATDARRVVEELARSITTSYVFPEKRASIVDAMRAAQRDGRLEAADASSFADRVTEVLFSASQDKHLRLGVDADACKRLQAAGPGEASGPWTLEAIRRNNHGYEELRILEGNVRLARITHFMWADDETGSVIDAVARFLRGGDAIIIDLRGNGGGDARAVQYLASYFFDSDRPLMTFEDLREGRRRETRVLSYLGSPRLVGKRLFVLVDGDTASAAEEFAYHVAQFKLGTLVGKTTAGAANNNTLIPIPPVFVASVSTGRPVHPVSGSNWEGVGIRPDIEVDAADPLERAWLLALEGIAAAPEAADRDALEWTIAGLRGHVHPPSLTSTELRAYAGRFGVRTVRAHGGALVFQRDGRPPLVLSPLAADLFAFPNTDDIRVQFRRDRGVVIGFDQITRDGQRIPSDRTGPAPR